MSQVFLRVPQADWPYHSCCAARKARNILHEDLLKRNKQNLNVRPTAARCTDVCGMWFWSLSFDNVELYLKTDKWCTYISITQSYGTVGIGSGSRDVPGGQGWRWQCIYITSNKHLSRTLIWIWTDDSLTPKRLSVFTSRILMHTLRLCRPSFMVDEKLL